MTITIRMNDAEADLIRSYAKVNNKSVSEIMRTFVLEKIEDEIDLNSYKQAMSKHQKNPQTTSFDEIWKEINK